ncbi:TRAP transporter large permease [Rhodococcus sp. NPDC057529]|uniref:TRAP transporter large permease n=1 Tax=Rhodococcus sp. NPDC057529 TaxID=3346158 RepID=UPI0036729899
MTSTVDLDVASHEPSDPNTGTAPRRWRSRVITTVLIGVLAASMVAMFLPLKPQVIGVTAIVMMVVMLLLRVPVAVTMIVPSLLGMYAIRGERTVVSAFADLPYGEVSSWTLSVVPMFVLMGLLLWKSGLTVTLFDAARMWLGWLPGGLAVGSNVAGSGLAAISGSTISTTYAVGRMAIPEMLKEGYDRRMAIGAVIVSGLPGQLIPPSIMLVLYAGIAEVPVGQQLLAGIGPGILVAILFTIMIVLFAKFVPSLVGRPGVEKVSVSYTWRQRFTAVAQTWPVPVLILIIVGGMFSGMFTATEAGAVAALASVCVVLIWKRRTGGAWRAVTEASVATVSAVGSIFLLLIGVAALSRMMTLTGISTGFADLIATMDLGRIEFLLLMMIVFLVLGAFMEPLPAMVLTVPILIPTLEALDISLLWYGVFVVFMGELAMVAPPVGVLAMIIHGICRDPQVNLGQRITLKDVFVAAGYFLPMAIIVALVLIFFPEIATFLPSRSAGN